MFLPALLESRSALDLVKNGLPYDPHDYNFVLLACGSGMIALRLVMHSTLSSCPSAKILQ